MQHMKSAVLYLKSTFSIILSLITVFGISVSLPTDAQSPFQRILPRSFLWVIIFFLLCIGSNILHKKTDSEQKRRAFFTALFYSICNALGYFFKHWGTITEIWETNTELLNFICFHLGFLNLAYHFVLLLFFVLTNNQKRTGNIDSPKHHYIFYFVIFLLLAWLPWIAYNLPGIITIDSNDHLSQAIGTSELYDHHPILHTLWIKFLYFICGNSQNTVMLYSIIQLLFSALTFSYCLYCIQKWFRIKKITFISFLFFALYPVFPIYGMTMWKDIPFALVLLLISINICKLVRAKESKQKALLFRNILLFSLLSLLRHNGIFIFIPVIIVFLFKYKAHRKFLSLAGFTAIAVFILFQTIGLSMLNVKKGRTSEGMSIPLQQIARVVTNHGSELTDSQKSRIDYFFYGQDLSKIYKATLSDPVKKSFNEDHFKADPTQFLSLWVELGLKHPIDFIESVLHNSYGYWYPEANQKTFFFGLYFGERFNLHQIQLYKSYFMQSLQGALENMKYYSFPIISWLFSPAIAVWILFFAFQNCRLHKSDLWLVHVPLICLWLQMFGSPAFCEFRYVYGLFTSLPIILCCSFLSFQS